MELDQLHPSGGYYAPQKPAAQTRLREEEIDSMTKSLPVIEDVIQWFDELIAAAGDVDSIDLRHKVPAESQILAMQLLKKEARKEQRKFKARFKNYLEATK